MVSWLFFQFLPKDWKTSMVLSKIAWWHRYKNTGKRNSQKVVSGWWATFVGRYNKKQDPLECCSGLCCLSYPFPESAWHKKLNRKKNFWKVVVECCRALWHLWWFDLKNRKKKLLANDDSVAAPSVLREVTFLESGIGIKGELMKTSGISVPLPFDFWKWHWSVLPTTAAYAAATTAYATATAAYACHYNNCC